MKKILIFAQSNVGGAERVTVTVTKSLDESRFKVVYYLVDMIGDGKNALLDFIPKDKEVHILERKHPLLMMWMFRKIIKKEQPSMVFSSSLYLNNKMLPWKRWFKNTHFIIRCENYLYTFSKKQRKLVEKTYKAADLIIAQTDEMKAELTNEAGIDEKKIVVLQNPIDKDTIDAKLNECRSPYPNDGKKRFVASGRFSEQKGFDLLVEAFAVVKKSMKDAELVIIGNTGGDNNEYYAKLKGLICHHGLQKDIHCVGYQDNPYQYVKYADCFVLSSRFEGLPNVLIEALYLGKPVAAFKCIPIIERIITDGENGYMAEKENSTSLADAMLKAVKLKAIKNHYQPAKIEDFHNLFEHCEKTETRLACEVKLKIKKLLRKTWLYKMKKLRTDSKLAKKREPYLEEIRKLVGNNVSIISSNCFAGRIMQDLKMEYNSPTLGLYFMYPDYNEFLQHLEHYLKNGKLTFVEHSKYALGDERRASRTITHHWYPIGLIDGKVEVHFLHYYTEEEAAEKWYRRAARVNTDNLLVIGMDQNRCTEQNIRDFDALPFKRKLIFSTHELNDVKSNVFMKEFAGKDSVGDPYKDGHLFYHYLVKWLKNVN